MSPLGKCLVFHLKYAPEMQRLYWREDEADSPYGLEGLPDAPRVREMVKAVGNAACREAADFLEECAREVAPVLTVPGRFLARQSSRRSSVEENWSVGLKIYREGSTTSLFIPGIWLTSGKVVPWIWCGAGRRWEQAAKLLLGERIHSVAGGGLVTDRGSVALTPIPVFPEGHQGFEVDREPLLAHVRHTFQSIVPDLEGLARIVEGGPGEDADDEP